MESFEVVLLMRVVIDVMFWSSSDARCGLMFTFMAGSDGVAVASELDIANVWQVTNELEVLWVS